MAWLKITKSCPCLSYFPGFFAILKVCIVFRNGETNFTPMKSNRLFLVNFSNVDQLSNVAVNSKPDNPPGRPPGIRTFSSPGGSDFRPTFFDWGGGGGWGWGRGFESEKFSAVLKEKLQELLDLFQRNRRQLEKQLFLCCFISIFVKTVDVYCIFNKINHFRPFRLF